MYNLFGGIFMIYIIIIKYAFIELIHPLERLYSKLRFIIKEKYYFIKYKKLSCIFEDKNKIFCKNDSKYKFVMHFIDFNNYYDLFTDMFGSMTYYYGNRFSYGHGHCLNDVLAFLFDSPESFYILDKDLSFYSDKDLKFINYCRKCLLEMGYKDLFDENEEPIREEFLKRNFKRRYKIVLENSYFKNNEEKMEKGIKIAKRLIVCSFILIFLIVMIVIF